MSDSSVMSVFGGLGCNNVGKKWVLVPVDSTT